MFRHYLASFSATSDIFHLLFRFMRNGLKPHHTVNIPSCKTQKPGKRMAAQPLGHNLYKRECFWGIALKSFPWGVFNLNKLGILHIVKCITKKEEH